MVEYNEKVLKHFSNPKNAGKIEDADGVGKVGNMTCLVSEETLHCNPKLIKISEISSGDKVLNHKGERDFVNSVFSRHYEGEILQLQNKLGKVKLTPEHLVYSIKLPKGQKFLRNKGKKTLVPSWYHANDLKKGDIILYPKLNQIKDVKYLEINIPKLKYDFRSKEIPKKILLNGDFLRLGGYYLSEGYASTKITNMCLAFSFNINQKDYAKDIRKIAKNLFNLNVVFRENKEKNTLVVYLHNAQLTRFFKELFGKGAENKRIPEFMLFLPLEKQKELIRGLWRGDGCINLNRDGPRAGYSTISYQLVQQIKILLLRQNIVPSLYIEKEKEVKGVKHKKSFRVHVGQRESLLKLSNLLGAVYHPRSFASVDSWFDDNYLYTPITKIEKENYKGQVFNLEVTNNHSFISEAFSLHNCGDVMYVYIKVRKKKINGKEEEIISDIKFQTLGCAAAVATSDVVVGLAKGKTILEALKITNKNVIDYLGGLPPIKVHCSLLAEEALSEAIYDYMIKKRKKVPKELEEKHKRNQEHEKNFHDKFKCEK